MYRLFVLSRGPPMTARYEPDHELEDRLSRRLLDVFIRAGLVVVLVLLCYLIFSPFLTMMLWALILAITIYPLHQMLAARIGGRQGLAATLIVLLAVGVIVTPTIMLASEFGDLVQDLIKNVRDNTLQIPAPSEKIAAWPVVGAKVHAVWSQAHNDLPGLVQSMQPKLGELASKALGIVAALGGGLLMFLFSFVVAGIIMAYGESGARVMQEIFERIAGIARGKEFTKLSTATVRAVASGVIGIACIQALIIGVSLMIAGVPFAGVLAVVVLVFGVAQLPALIVTLPVIGWIWASGEYDTGPAVAYTVLLFVGGMADNVLKPLMLGTRRRCTDAGHPDRCARRHGDHRHPRHVRRRDRARAGLPNIHALGERQSGAGAANRRGRFPLHCMSRCADVSPVCPERGCAPWSSRCCSEAAPRLGRTSSALRCHGWLAGQAARSIR